MPISLVVLLVWLGAWHPGSISRSLITVDGSVVKHSQRVQALSLIEVLPIDLDDDSRLGPEELKAARDPILEYLTQTYQLRVNGSSQPLSMTAGPMDAFLEGSPELPSNSWLQIDWVGSGDAPVESLVVTETMFEVTAPDHIEYMSVAWTGQVASEVVLHSDIESHEFVPGGEAKSVLHAFFVLGIDHILSGYDHLLFLLALLVAICSLKELAWVVTAFTLAHSVTLALAAFELVSLPSQFVEMAIALSIVYVAAETLLGLGRRSLWIVALVFGLLHGLGFAGFLREALYGEATKLLPLVGFNVGVEAGQLVALLPPALVFGWFARRRSSADGPRTLVPTGLGKALSLLVVLLGLYWFLERAGFVDPLPF